MVVQWLEFSSPVYEQLYWEHFTRAYHKNDLYVCIVNILFGASWVWRVWRINPWWDTGYVVMYMAAHFVLLWAIWKRHPFFVNNRHNIVSLDRVISFVALAQGQWRIIKLSGMTHDWDAIVANVLGFGTATMLAWHAINHRLPFNRSLALSLLQFCLLIGTNGLIVDALRTEFPEKLNVGAEKANWLGTTVFGSVWPQISGAAYFAVLFCGTRQLIAFFYVTWFIYKMEHGHRRAFLLQYQIDPDTCGFSHTTHYDVAFLVANIIAVTATMTNELVVLYECPAAALNAVNLTAMDVGLLSSGAAAS